MTKEVLIARHSNVEGQIEFMEITKGKAYVIEKDNFGEYIMDDCADEFYLQDLKKVNPFKPHSLLNPANLYPWKIESTNSFVRVSEQAWLYIQEQVNGDNQNWKREWEKDLDGLELREYERGFAVKKLVYFDML